MQMQAAVIEAKSGPFVITEVELDDPRPDEILVRIVASGICQTDLHVRNQDLPTPFPVILGHEGSGVVERIGESVTTLQPGDHVVLSYASCGHCGSCLTGHACYCDHAFEENFGGSRLDGTNGVHRKSGSDGPPIHSHFFGQSSFATYSLVNERNAVKVPKDIPLPLLAPLGCGFQTGAGGVLNSLRVKAGSSIAIFGVGAVGLAAVMAAQLAGATTIIAVDVSPERLALAKELGATHIINGKEQDTAQKLKQISGRGVDYVLEITGKPQMVTLAVNALAPMGTVGLIGAAPAGTQAPIDMQNLAWGRSVRGIVQGDATPQVFIPKLIEMYRAGKFPFDRLVRYYDFADINVAIDDAARGEVIKPILRIGSEKTM
jgi:aryl-alcohol dehydrogenase